MAGSHIGDKLRGIFERASHEARFTTADLKKATGASGFTLNYHMNILIKEKLAERIAKGVYARDQRFVSVSAKREAVEEHIQTHGSRIQPGDKWQAGQPEAVSKVDLNYLVAREAYAIQMHTQSLVQRMGKHPETFTEADVALLQRLMFKSFPISEQQRNVIDKEIKDSMKHAAHNGEVQK